MKHYVVVFLFCIGLILSRAPLSLSDYSSTTGNVEYGVVFAYDCSCYTPPLDLDPTCFRPVGADGNFEYKRGPWCDCTYFGIEQCSDPELTQTQIDAIAAVIMALQNAQSYADSASSELSILTTLYNSLGTLQASLADYRGQVSGAVYTINKSLSLVAGYLQQGQVLGAEALEIVERQVAMAVLQRGLSDLYNKNTQGGTVGDPVLIASGFESYQVQDLRSCS